MRPFAIAGLQFAGAGGDNLAAIEHEVRSIARRFPWVRMVLGGELCVFGADVAHAQPLPGDAENRLCALARDTGLWLVAGSLFERDGDRVYNTAPVIAPDGRVVARHRKLYPFAPYESGVTPGSDHTVFDVPGTGRFGISTCYDMWFPETTRSLVWLGAEIVLHPTMTTTIDRDSEIAIARASAVTNQCYFIDINVAGTLGVGRSCAFGPGGEALHLAGSGHEVIALDLDLDHVRRVRERGWNGLGQALKSFRDGPARFPAYGADRHPSPALDALGPLTMPGSEASR